MKNLSQKLRKFGHLTSSDQLKVVQLFTLLVTAKVSLLVFPFSTLIKHYKNCLNIRTTTVAKEHRSTANLLSYAASVLPKVFTCLPKALVYKYLFRNSKEVLLIIGVQRSTNNHFTFHAWVEKNNEILINDTKEESFNPLWEIN